MKIFFLFMLAATLISGYFWATDGPGSGMQYPTILFALLAVGVGVRNTVVYGSPFRDGPKL
jgi:hypothetical protein